MLDLVPALRAAGATLEAAQAWADPVKAAAALYAIEGRELAAWLAQCGVETGGFARTEESLVYLSAARICEVFGKRMSALAPQLVRAPQALGNAVYADRLGNGPRASGDGWSYRGRGLIHLTGRANYAEAGAKLGRPYLTQPDLVAKPSDAALSAAWWWWRHGCGAALAAGGLDAVTRLVNGPAMEAAAERRDKFAKVLAALGYPSGLSST